MSKLETSWFLLELSRHNIPVPSTFVETGAYMGDGIEQYIKCIPFQRINSIELSPPKLSATPDLECIFTEREAIIKTNSETFASVVNID